MILRYSISILLTTLCFTLSACSKNPNSHQDPTGLKRRMTIEQTVDILGKPNTIKPAGENKLIYIYKLPSETIMVFFIDGSLKSIEHIARQPKITHLEAPRKP
jgi:hypothetical protein